MDPEARTLEAFELTDGHWVLLETATDSVSVSIPPFDAISFDLGDLWADDDEAKEEVRDDGIA